MNSCSGLGTEFFPRSSFIVRDLGSSLVPPNLHAQQHGSPLGTLKLRIHERKEVRICPLLLPSLIIHFITLEKGKMHTGVRHMCSKFMCSKAEHMCLNFHKTWEMSMFWHVYYYYVGGRVTQTNYLCSALLILNDEMARTVIHLMLMKVPKHQVSVECSRAVFTYSYNVISALTEGQEGIFTIKTEIGRVENIFSY